MVEVTLALAVALHRTVAQLDQVDVGMAVAASDDRLHRGGYSFGRALYQLRPVKQFEVLLEGLDLAGRGRHQLRELPIVFGGEADTLVVGD